MVQNFKRLKRYCLPPDIRFKRIIFGHKKPQPGNVSQSLFSLSRIPPWVQMAS